MRTQMRLRARCPTARESKRERHPVPACRRRPCACRGRRLRRARAQDRAPSGSVSARGRDNTIAGPCPVRGFNIFLSLSLGKVVGVISTDSGVPGEKGDVGSEGRPEYHTPKSMPRRFGCVNKSWHSAIVHHVGALHWQRTLVLPLRCTLAILALH